MIYRVSLVEKRKDSLTKKIMKVGDRLRMFCKKDRKCRPVAAIQYIFDHGFYYECHGYHFHQDSSGITQESCSLTFEQPEEVKNHFFERLSRMFDQRDWTMVFLMKTPHIVEMIPCDLPLFVDYKNNLR